MKDGSGTVRGRWTDLETLLLLECIEKFNDNWNHIVGHVETKSKAQYIHRKHFCMLLLLCIL
jgi:SWI/SNF related-matrix-associated actin-dependent regulator of chromatin subfamily C